MKQEKRQINEGLPFLSQKVGRYGHHLELLHESEAKTVASRQNCSNFSGDGKSWSCVERQYAGDGQWRYQSPLLFLTSYHCDLPGSEPKSSVSLSLSEHTHTNIQFIDTASPITCEVHS